MYSNNKKKITGLGKEREESIFLCCLFKCGTHLWSDISGSVTSCPFSWKDDHSPECTWTTLAKEKEGEREAEAWSQGLRRAAWTPVSPAGSHRTWVPFASQVKPQALPSTWAAISARGISNEQVRGLKAQAPPLKLRSLRIKPKPRQRSLWSKKSQRARPGDIRPSWLLLQSNSGLYFQSRAGKTWRRMDELGEGHGERKSTTTLPSPQRDLTTPLMALGGRRCPDSLINSEKNGAQNILEACPSSHRKLWLSYCGNLNPGTQCEPGLPTTALSKRQPGR